MDKAAPSTVEVTSDYVRGHHCVFLRGRFGPLWNDLELHLLQNEQKLEAVHQLILEETIVACTLHHANRPHNEMSAWTINLVEPAINVFVTGDNENGTIAGRVFTQNVKHVGVSRLHAQTKRPGLKLRESTVDIEGIDAFAFAERYYLQSEQLPARFFRLDDRDEFAMIVAQPDFDEKWFASIDAAAVAKIPETEELGPLERRRYRFLCGCNATIIRKMIRDASPDLDELFFGESELRVVCPRCAASFRIKRSEFESSPPPPSSS